MSVPASADTPEAPRGIFQRDELVMAVVVQPGGGRPVTYLGVVIGEDDAGILIRPTSDASGKRRVYLPFSTIETVLLHEREGSIDARRRHLKDELHKQRVLDELDRIFFEMVEKRGRYRSNSSKHPDADAPSDDDPTQSG